ncbi:N-acetylmuramoyl-L-alanine amidase [Streptomyces sp. WAC05374]|uniref:N-acetylmuramoyl-L-alanine amidase n=1 Tax=Streptomyces sp. WAC05374 TaxID=2487420 RepID=UPI000F87AE81|nr:peptidoglycan recognition family protein [Streptomyces sp. WAC05374]RST10426.1 N-acetylmuramoyl-L-alanine amidase [Streptomyces sp. WAC05374]TDF50858.1 N-acetylmuramoyl-L-alanine amidase [Streptomyces sp. WAC05374]TDF58108.1 N-acetylmuramoyl-L-alanine amidase [Streptomyces sp. WAC05374]TDF60587.1 N-acetylmuramoyl-L-alanine amidase [Streptomyces sp. WAC05374]
MGALVASAALLLPLVSAAPPATAGRPPAPGALQRDFAAAAAEYGVPPSVLLAVSYLQSRSDGHGGAPSVTGGYGPMHLTDAATALASAPHHSHGTEDPRGDTSRPAKRVADAGLPAPSALPPRLRTLERAAGLSGLSPEDLRTSTPANIRGGAALLAAAQRELGHPVSTDPGDWYGAVARYSGADDTATATTYADDVYDVIRSGERRTTDSGQVVALAPDPGVAPRTAQAAGLGLRTADAAGTECPVTVACEWVPAPYEEFGEGDYGNHDKADRPASQSVDYIVVHDTEATWDVTLKLVQDPAYVSWHYSLRSSDGHIAQHVPLKDVGWHAGNWYVNAKSVGLEHEGFLVSPDAWYTEAMYRTSARLVRYLAKRYGVPLDRQHILGHDNVPGPTGAAVRGMHTDPGPYWDWAHYFTLLGRPFTPAAGPRAGVVTIRPRYAAHQPLYTGCAKPGEACPPHGSGAVRLYTEPRESAPLVKDAGLRPGGQDSTTGVNDTGARASTGQRYAVAERRGEWTAIWYLGQKAWFHDPRTRPVAVGSRGWVLTPREGLAEVPVYGRAYPEASAYPAGVPVQAVSPLPYRLLAGQRYVVGDRVPGEYFYAPSFDTSGHRVVRGEETYYEIQFGHRVAFVKASDVVVTRA